MENMVVQSKVLSFMKFTSQDFEHYFLLNKNIRVMQFITGKALTEEEACQRFEKNLQINNEHLNLCLFMVRNVISGDFLGLAKLTPYTHNVIEIGYSLLPEYWGKGYASEIVRCLIDYASTINFRGNLIAIVHPDNHASKKVLAKNNFIYTRSDVIDNRPAEFYELVNFNMPPELIT